MNLTGGSHRKTSLAGPASINLSEIYHAPSSSSLSSLNEAEPEIFPARIKLILASLSLSSAASRRINLSELLLFLSDLKFNQSCLSSKLVTVETYPEDCADRHHGRGLRGAIVVKVQLGQTLSVLGFGLDYVNFVTGLVWPSPYMLCLLDSFSTGL